MFDKIKNWLNWLIIKILPSYENLWIQFFFLVIFLVTISRKFHERNVAETLKIKFSNILEIVFILKCVFKITVGYMIYRISAQRLLFIQFVYVNNLKGW